MNFKIALCWSSLSGLRTMNVRTRMTIPIQRIARGPAAAMDRHKRHSCSPRLGNRKRRSTCQYRQNLNRKLWMVVLESLETKWACACARGGNFAKIDVAISEAWGLPYE